MQIELVAYTQPNPILSPHLCAKMGDLAVLWQGRGTFAENVIEYAGRVCYRSTARMGTAPDFIGARVREAGFEPHVFPEPRTRSWARDQKRLARWIEALPKPIGLMTCDDLCGRSVLEACRTASDYVDVVFAAAKASRRIPAPIRTG